MGRGFGGGGGWAGASEGRVLSNFFTNWGGSNLFYSCFQSLANFPLAFSFSHETMAKAFLVGTIGPKERVESVCRILFENSVYSPFGFGSHPKSSSFHFSGLTFSLVPAADVPPTESEE